MKTTNNDPMTFMTPEQAAKEDEKAKAFIKAFRFGTPEFFKKIMNAYEKHGLDGINMIANQLAAYEHISNIVTEEAAAAINIENNSNSNAKYFQEDYSNLL